MRIHDRDTIRQTLVDNVRLLKEPGWFFFEDTNLGKPEDFDKAKLRILILFLSAGETRAVSSTDIVLTSIVQQHLGDQAFVDVCFLPTQHNAEVLDKLNLPWVFGGLSHRHINEFDMVIVSNAIIDEKINIFPLFLKSDFPLWSTERFDKEHPLVMLGGHGASEAEPLYGVSADGKNRCIPDCTYTGFAERFFPDMLKTLLAMHTEQSLRTRDKKELAFDLVKDYENIYIPWAYDHILAEDNWTIKEIVRNTKRVPKRVKFAKVLPEDCENVAGFENKLLYSHGNYDSNDIQISFGCSGGYVCSFCHEGNLQAWREKSVDKIVKEMQAARNKSLSSTISFYSYNTNYHTQYEDMMKAAASMYPKISAIAMRADEIAARPDYFKMNKYLGLSRITLGVEGVSARLRDGYMTKALSEQSIFEAANACFMNRFMQVKLFFILAGVEEQQDWEEGVKMIKTLVRMRDESGANTHLRVSFSILCYYPDTSIAWEERRAVKHTIEKGRISYFIEECKKMGVGTRFSSRGMSTVFQQYNLDVGRPMTAIYDRLYNEQGFIWYRNVPDSIVHRLLELCEEYGLPDYKKILDQRPYDWIFPSDTIFVKSRQFLVKAAKKLKNMEPVIYCMPTQSKNEARGCDSCGLCNTKELVAITSGRVSHGTNVPVDEVILTLAKNKPYHRYRFEFRVPKEAAFLVKRPLAHYHIAKLLPEEFKPEVYSVGSDGDPGRWTICNETPYSFHGKYFFDLLTKVPMPELPMDRDLGLLKLKGIHEIPLKFALKPNDLVLSVMSVRGDSRLYQGLRSGSIRFPWMKNDFPLEWSHDAGTVDFSLVKGEIDKLLVVHPIRSNMVKWLSDLTGKNYMGAYKDNFISLEHVTYMRPVPGFGCRLCTSDAYIDLTTGKQVSLCPAHTQSLVLKALSKGKKAPVVSPAKELILQA